MRLDYIKGDDQDRVFSLYDLATTSSKGQDAVERLLNNKKRFHLTKEDIETLENADKIFKRCWHLFLWDIRCPD